MGYSPYTTAIITDTSFIRSFPLSNLQVGGPVNKDMENQNYTEEFDPNNYQIEFFPGMADFIDENIVAGDKVKITVAPKGFGSENMSRIKMLRPADGIEGVKDFIIETVKLAGPNPCPPMVIGVGIGGTFDKAAYLAKKSLIRSIDERNKIDFYKNLEIELLESINKLGIGPQGFGGKTTAIGLNIETYPTHIAGLPVAVNISCHATRHKEIVL
jgi:fumarate hydratase subunit alpha